MTDRAWVYATCDPRGPYPTISPGNLYLVRGLGHSGRDLGTYFFVVSVDGRAGGAIVTVMHGFRGGVKLSRFDMATFLEKFYHDAYVNVEVLELVER